MSGPLVSIIIPCHNAAPWLAASLESALAQTWTWREVVVVDDGSTDDSQAIARRFEPRGVRVLAQPPGGASAARNRALREARGEVFQFLDADDLISPEKIARQMATLARHPPGTIATCSWGRFAREPAEALFVDQPVFRDFAPLDFLLLAATTGAMIHPSAWLVPRAVAARAGPWDETLTLNDDGEYFARVVLASAGLAYCADDDAKSFYRSRQPGSLSQRRSEAARRSQFRSLELISHHLLAAETSARTRQAVADLFQRFLHDFFPAPADLMRLAAIRVAEFGGSSLQPQMGPKTAALASVLGWKNVWRLRHLAQR